MAVKRKQPTPTDVFSMVFLMEHVEILTKVRLNQGIETPDGIVDHESPLVVQGYILDVDDEYYYIGTTVEEVTEAVKKDVVDHISIIKVKDNFDEILDDMPTPTKKDFN